MKRKASYNQEKQLPFGKCEEQTFMGVKLVGLALLSALLVATLLPFAYAETLVLVSEWDTQNGGCSNIACDNLGNIYITTSARSSTTGPFYMKYFVEKYDSNGNFLTQWGGYYSEEGKGGFGRDIYGIAADDSGNVFVSDYENYLIQKFDSNGNFLIQWEIDRFEYGAPFGVAVDSTGNVYVVAGGHILKFDGYGNLITQWKADAREIAVDNTGHVYTSSYLKYNISKFDQNGNFITNWGSEGSGDEQSSYTYSDMSIAVDGEGNVYVVNPFAYSNDLQKFDSNGNFITKLDIWGGHGIAIDHSGNICFALGIRVAKYKVESGSSTLSSGSPAPSASPFPSPSIPEFPSFIVVPISMASILVGAILYKRKLRQSQTTDMES